MRQKTVTNTPSFSLIGAFVKLRAKKHLKDVDDPRNLDFRINVQFTPIISRYIRSSRLSGSMLKVAGSAEQPLPSRLGLDRNSVWFEVLTVDRGLSSQIILLHFAGM